MRYNNSRQQGFTLIESVIYVGLLGMIAVLVASFLLHLFTAYQRIHIEREVLSNARLVLERIEKEIAQAEEIYGPTSKFFTDAGQLSLVISDEPSSVHQIAYEDFWIDNGRLWFRKEGQGELAFSAESVRITQFRLERIMQAISRDAVKITFTISPAQEKIPSSVTLHSAVVLRGIY